MTLHESSMSLPFVTQHIHGQRCLCLSDYAISERCIVRNLQIAMPGVLDGNAATQMPRLRHFEVVITREYVVRLLARVLDGHQDERGLRDLSLWVEGEGLWWRAAVHGGAVVLGLLWQRRPSDGLRLQYDLRRIVRFGCASADSLDLCYDLLETVIRAFMAGPWALSEGFITMKQNVFSFEPIAFMMSDLFLGSPMPAPVIEGGSIAYRMDGDDIHLVYDAQAQPRSDAKPAETEALEIVDWQNSLSDLPMLPLDEPHNPEGEKQADSISDSDEHSMFRKIRAYGQASDSDENWLFSSNPSEPMPSPHASGAGCLGIAALHRAMEAGESISGKMAGQALGEARKVFNRPLMVALAYVIHVYAPQHDEALQIDTWRADSDVRKDVLMLSILCEVYRRRGQDVLYMELLQHQIKFFEGVPHRSIALGLELAELLSSGMNWPAAAIKRLDGMKALVHVHGTLHERIACARAYHQAQGTSMGLHLLRQFMKQATTPRDIAEYGYAIAQMMIEHNDPPHSIIQACLGVLEVAADHIQTQRILAQCLESSGRIEDSALVCEQILDRLERDLDTERARVRHASSLDRPDQSAAILEEAVGYVSRLEQFYDLLEKPSQKILVLKRHLHLAPGSLGVMSKLLRQLEAIEAFQEMIQICLAFLDENGDKLQPEDEIAVQLTLHNIYEKLQRQDEAASHLARARNLSPIDPRVISAEIEYCRRRGMKKEQVGLRLSLIEVLPSHKAITQALDLVQLYEDLNESPEVILDTLRKAHRMDPNARQVLLELRYYLRKNKHFFELASVLEKLARLTKDVQSRKNILLEASETQQQLGNTLLAKKLYAEAQILSPINPDNKFEYMPSAMALPSSSPIAPLLTTGTNDVPHSLDIQSYPSLVLTSRSLSVIDLREALTDGKAEVSSQPLPVVSLSSSDPSVDALKEVKRPPREVSIVEDADLAPIDSSLPLEVQIVQARTRGQTQALLEFLLKSLNRIDSSLQEPRVLQEIGCIYLYDKHDPGSAAGYLERASLLSAEVANGEQTLNALESIYESLSQYEKLGQVYLRKRTLSTLASERRRYDILYAQLCYEHLGETSTAIDALKRILADEPENEAVLQLLAQIYITTHCHDKAIETLEMITPLLGKNTKAMAQHQLRIVMLYIERDRIEEAKSMLRDLLDHNAHIDKLAVIEYYKRICRAHDEWQDLLEILKDELCYYLRMPRAMFSMEVFTRRENSEVPLGYAVHTLREYADILYYKLDDLDQAALLYQTIAALYPEDNYTFNVLCEMLEAHPSNIRVLKAVVLSRFPEFERHASESSPDVPQEGEVLEDGEQVGVADLDMAYAATLRGDEAAARVRLERIKCQIVPREVDRAAACIRMYWDAPKTET